MPRGCSAHQMKGLETLICLATKILKIGLKLRELLPWQSTYPELPVEITITLHIPIQFTKPEMMSAFSILENFDCQGHNSLNLGLVFKPKHISFPRPFFYICWTTTWHVPTWPETCLKFCPSKMKITKVEKNGLLTSSIDTLHDSLYSDGHRLI